MQNIVSGSFYQAKEAATWCDDVSEVEIDVTRVSYRPRQSHSELHLSRDSPKARGLHKPPPPEQLNSSAWYVLSSDLERLVLHSLILPFGRRHHLQNNHIHERRAEISTTLI